MTPHFTLEEFAASGTARARGIDNTLPPSLEPAAMATLEMMERIRMFLSERAGRDTPIKVSSGYRCPALNLAIGSSSTSDHPKACAVDWTSPSFGPPLRIAQLLAPAVGALGIGQLIYEFVGDLQWIHTSTRMPEKPLNRIITIRGGFTFVGIKEV